MRFVARSDMLSHYNNPIPISLASEPFDLIDEALVDVVDASGRVLFMNKEQSATLGVEKASSYDLDISTIYTYETVRQIEALFERDLPEGFQTTFEFSLVGRGGRIVRTLARARSMVNEGEQVYRFVKIVLAGHSEELDSPITDEKILRQIVDQASEGHWCIEFLEPVDLDVSKSFAIDQIFENVSVWRLTNRAMDRLYDLPSGESIGADDVRLYWPRSEVNEQFISEVYDANFHIDNALAVDCRHDGTEIRVENDVRADIEDRLLYRIWGNCRDVSLVDNVEAKIQFLTSDLIAILNKVPTPILAINTVTVYAIYNTAFTTTFEVAESMKIELQKLYAQWLAAGGNDNQIRLIGNGRSHKDCTFDVTTYEASNGTSWTFLTLNCCT